MSTSTIPLFGKKYSLLITTKSGEVIEASNSEWEPESLKFTAEIQLTALAGYWEAFVSIYNLNSNSSSTFIQQGASISISAGYQTGSNYGEIFNGKILRCTFTKQDSINHVLQIQAITGLDVLINNFVNYASGPFSTQSDLINQMMQNANTPITLSDPGKLLNSTSQLPCPKVFFGTPASYLKDATRQSNTFHFVDTSGQVNILQLQLASDRPDLIYSPAIPPGAPSNITPQQGITYSIIGTPEQQINGISFRVQLDARLQIRNPPMGVKLDNTVIQQLPISLGSAPPVLSKSGTYAVTNIRHVLDTHSSDWYTEVIGILTGAAQLQLGVPNSDNRYNNLGPYSGN